MLQQGNCAGAWVQGQDLVPRHNSGHQVPVCTAMLLVIMQTTASYSLQSSSFQVASDSVKGNNCVDSFISGTQDVN